MNTVNNLETLQYISEIYRVVNGNLEKMTIEEYKEEIQKSQEMQQQMKTVEKVKQEDSSQRQGRVISVHFREELGNYYLEEARQVSATVDGGEAGGQVTATQGITKEVGINIGVEFPFKSMGVTLNAGFSVSESRSTEVGHSVNVPVGKKAYLAFSPRMYYARGITEICQEFRLGNGEYETSCKDRSGGQMTFPVNVQATGILDGEYKLIIVS